MLKVVKAGFYTTIQDVGRFGHRCFGVPVSGPMDGYSSHFANALLGNAKDAALIEITMVGPTLQFLQPTLIAISGADISPIINGNPVKMNNILKVDANDTLSFGKLKSGIRSYLAIKDGFLSDMVLKSRSMYKDITPHYILSNGDTVPYKFVNDDFKKANAHVKYDNSILKEDVLEVSKGPEFNKLPTEIQQQIFSKEFRVSKLNNRMAFQLEPLIKNDLKQILTAPVLPGTVQLTPSGQLIVLMRDCQTTGGYPRVLQLTEKSINVLSQKYTGNSLKIRLSEL